MEAIKGAINYLSYPWWSFTISLVAFWFAVRSRFLWTKAGGWALHLGITVFFAASMLDPNFRAVVAKPDNVPIVMMIYLISFFWWYAMYKAQQNDDRTERGEPIFEKTESEDRIFTWPDLVMSEFICMIVLTVGMVSARYRLVILTEPELAGDTELYRLILTPGGVLESKPHGRGAVEQLPVLSGEVEVRCGGDRLRLAAGRTARYAADVAHAIAATGKRNAEALLFVRFDKTK